MKTMQATNTESAIWGRLFRPTATTLSAEAARSVLRLDFTAEDKDRMRELAAKAREGTLTLSEKGEIRNYEHVGNVLAMWKSKARQRLKKLATANGAQH